MVSINRAKKIAERIQEELSNLLVFEVADPRLENVSITDVKVDKELAFADIYVSSFEGSSRMDDILQGFEKAKGFLRYQLAQRIQLRTFPRLRFHWDPTPERADRIEKLFAQLHSAEETVSDEDNEKGNESNNP